MGTMDATNRSLDPLHFTGPLQVHGLYDYLLRWREPRSDRRSQCFPVLYASHPFVNASLKAAKVTRSLSAVQQVTASASSATTSSSTTTTTEGFKMTLKGLILPSATGPILRALSQQNPDFTSNSQSLDQTRGVHSAITGGSQVHRVISCHQGGPFFSRES